MVDAKVEHPEIHYDPKTAYAHPDKRYRGREPVIYSMPYSGSRYHTAILSKLTGRHVRKYHVVGENRILDDDRVYIGLVRDPRDVILSQARRRKRDRPDLSECIDEEIRSGFRGSGYFMNVPIYYSDPRCHVFRYEEWKLSEETEIAHIMRLAEIVEVPLSREEAISIKVELGQDNVSSHKYDSATSPHYMAFMKAGAQMYTTQKGEGHYKWRDIFTDQQKADAMLYHEELIRFLKYHKIK